MKRQRMWTANSRCVFWGSVATVFALMLVWNILTPMMADDFSYSYSFATEERIASLGDIAESLAAHGETMNGRIVAHFFAQLFLWLPGWLFDGINALLFVAQLLLMLRICGATEGTRTGLFWLFAVCLFLATPDFGQVNLWLDGACNYLWSIVFALLFLLPYVDAFLRERRMHNPLQIFLFWVVSFLAGAYLENVSGAAILMAGLFWIGNRLYGNKKLDPFLLVGLLFAVAGLATIALSPAQFANKASSFSFGAILQTFLIALGVLGLLALPIGIDLFLLFRARKTGVGRRVILTSLIFVTGALASNFVMVLASYYPLRCAIGCTVFLTVAAGILAACMDWDWQTDRVLRRSSRMLLVALLLAVILGTVDIAATHHAIRQNEAVIADAREAGEHTVTLTCPTPYTKYSGLYNLKYLGIGTAHDWPNGSMARYFDIGGIIGRDAE